MAVYDLVSLGKAAVAASRVLSNAGTDKKNSALAAIASALGEKQSEILSANRIDIENARRAGLRDSLIDRLSLNESRIKAIASAVEEIIGFADPVGVIEKGLTNRAGLSIVKQRVPLGVIAMIYEARPNVTVDAAALCLKSGNVCILRGGKEAFATNRTLVSVMRKAVAGAGLPADVIALVEDTSHETAERLMRLDKYVDVLIPRGSARLIQTVLKTATIPVIETGIGNCHMYVDAAADLAMAVRLVDNAKTSRPSVCNAIETVLVHKDIAADFLPAMQNALNAHSVQLRGCKKTREILKDVKEATEQDYAEEFLDYILAVKVVEGLDEAIEHIEHYSSKHSEAIVTDSFYAANRFVAQVDAAAVYVNASTRYTDGGEFGLGAEIGISTQKLHARGPMGIMELTSNKYIVMGNGQTR
jgi:glutamate-5-semialdehyde dehydrogenase